MVGRDDEPGAVVRLIAPGVAGAGVLALLVLAGSASAQAPPEPEVPEAVASTIAASAVVIEVRTDRADMTLSGVVIDPSGLLLTSAHGIGCVERIDVTMPGGELELKADVVALDDVLDLALLRVKPKKKDRPAAATIGSAPASGDAVWAWGETSAARPGRVMRALPDEQTLAMKSRSGDSGGPVFAPDGAVIGVVSAYLLGQKRGADRTTAVSRDAVDRWLAAADRDGKVSKATLCHDRRKVWHYLSEATEYYGRGKVEFALTVLQLALDKADGAALETHVRLQRAVLYGELKRWEDMVQDLTMVLQIEPHHLDARMDRAWARYELRQYERALADLDAAAEAHPGEAKVQGHRAWALYGLDRTAEANDAMAVWVATGDANGNDLGLKCKLSIQLGAFDDAGTECGDALAAGYDEPTVYVDLATALRETGDLEGSLRSLDLAIEAGVDDPRVRFNRALHRLHFDRTMEALEDVEALLDADPADGNAWHVKALALGRQRDRAGAIQAATKAAELGAPGAAELLRYLKDGGLVDKVNVF